MPKNYKRVLRPVTPQEKLFIKLISKGVKRSEAFREAYPEHHAVKRFMDVRKLPNDPQNRIDRQRTASTVIQLAKDKLQTKHIQSAMVTYQKKMDEFSDLALTTAIDLVENAKSEKVRADLAIEGIRHRVGSPVQKMQVQQQQDIVITFGGRHPNDVIDVEPEE